MTDHALRINNKLIIVNGRDPLKYIDLSHKNVHHYSQFKPGEIIIANNKIGTFIRLVVPKRDPYSAPQKAIVQFQNNKGTSQIKLAELKSA